MLTPVGVVVRFLHLILGTALWGIALVLVEAPPFGYVCFGRKPSLD